MPIAFYCRARPQGCDAFKIFESAGRVFIGYPLLRKDKTYDPKALRSCIVNPMLCSDGEWNRLNDDPKYKKFYTQNRNFIPQVEEGAIVVIPRPREGAAYLARITGQFEIVDAPTWGQAYLELREHQGLNAKDENAPHHIPDVAQGWPVDRYWPVKLSHIPGWMRRSLFGRSTYGRFDAHHPLDEDETSYDVLDKILNGSPLDHLSWTLELDEIKRRLVNTLNNPSAFENLVVSLLQLEHPDEMWHHTGGSGDGGIDGFGVNDAGEVVGLMQAKFIANRAPNLGNPGGNNGERIRRYAAVFLPKTPREPSDGTCLLNLEWIADAVRRHWRRLPLALTMRVGEDNRHLQ